MPKYRKKPVVIDAWKWEGKNLHDARLFTDKNGLPNWGMGSNGKESGLIIPTLEGDHVARSGDFIIQGVNGEFYPCKPDIFKKTYDEVSA